MTIFKQSLCPVERKNGWQMAEQVGYTNPYRLQHLLGRARWDEEQICAEVRDYVVEHLDDGTGILAVDETSFLKRGEESVGVGRQYCGLTGQIENCQVGVFLAYKALKGTELARPPSLLTKVLDHRSANDVRRLTFLAR